MDFTYVPTWPVMAFTAFVHDTFSRRIVGWRTAASMPTELPLDALEMALWTRACAGEDGAGLVHHSNAGSQYTAIRSSDRLLDAGAVASIATVGDSYDNAQAESLMGLYKAERTKHETLARHRRPRARHPELGSTGSTRPGCTGASAMSRRWSTRPSTTVTSRPCSSPAGTTQPLLNPARFRLIESTNTKIRLLTRMAFGFKSPGVMTALAMLNLGSYRPSLPGRQSADRAHSNSGKPIKQARRRR